MKQILLFAVFFVTAMQPADQYYTRVELEYIDCQRTVTTWTNSNEYIADYVSAMEKKHGISVKQVLINRPIIGSMPIPKNLMDQFCEHRGLRYFILMVCKIHQID